MWRHEDIFFAALGGGGFGQPPIQTPEEIAGRVWPEDGRATSLTLAPIMHGAAQWGMCIMLFGGGKVVLYTPHGFDPHEAWVLAERERAMTVMVVGDAMARPLGEALDQKSYDLSSVVSVGSGGAVYSAAVKAKLKEHLPNVLTIDTVGASELGASGSQQDPDAGPRFNTIESMSVLGEDLRPVEPGSGQVGLLARRGHIPLGYYKDEAKTAATFVTDPDGVRWSVPGDHARIEADGTITPPAAARGAHTGGEKVYPEEVEAAIKSHPDVFDVIVVGVPDAVHRAGGGDRAAPHRSYRDARGCREPLPHDDRGLQGAARAQGRRRHPAHAVGEGRLPLGEAAVRDRAGGGIVSAHRAPERRDDAGVPLRAPRARSSARSSPACARRSHPGQPVWRSQSALPPLEYDPETSEPLEPEFVEVGRAGRSGRGRGSRIPRRSTRSTIRSRSR